jgi:hypothetical protein
MSRSVSAVVVAALLWGGAEAVLANDDAEDNVQSIVITYQQELFHRTILNRLLKRFPDEDAIEKACIAISLGLQLLLVTEETPHVTLFPATAGVWLANETLMDNTGVAEALCSTPTQEEPEAKTPLLEHLKNFIAFGGDVCVCPICYLDRYDPLDLVTAPGGATGEVYIGTPPDIQTLFMEADKSIDF